MFIPKETIDLVRDRSNIENIVKRYVPTLKKKGKNFVGLCPFHKEKTPSFTVSPEKNIFYCFGCQKGGNVFSFISSIERLNFPESVKFVADLIGIEIKSQNYNDRPGRDKVAEYFRLNNYAMNFYHRYLLSKDGLKGMNYLRKRGITDEIIEKFKIGYAPDSWDILKNSLSRYIDDLSQAETTGLLNSTVRNNSKHYYDNFRNRIIFPIFDKSNMVVAFGGRSIGDEMPKYKNSPESLIYKKREVLYGFNIARDSISELNRAIIVEGYFDVIACNQAGLYNVAAPLGTALTDSQADLLCRYCSDIVLIFDSDSAGINAALKSIQIFDRFNCEVRIARLPEGDPFDFLSSKGIREFMVIVDTAVKPVDFRISNIMKNYDSAGRVNTLMKLFSVIDSIKLNTEKSIYLQKISSLLDLDENSVRADYKNFSNKKKNAGMVIKETGKDENIDFITGSLRDLIKLICNFPELIEKASVDFSVNEITDDTTRNVFKKILEIYFSDQTFSVDKMFDFSDDGLEMEFLNETLAGSYSVDNPETVYNEIYAKIKLFDIDKKIKKYINLIKNSDKNSEEYLTEIEILRREKEKLSSFVYNQQI